MQAAGHLAGHQTDTAAAVLMMTTATTTATTTANSWQDGQTPANDPHAAPATHTEPRHQRTPEHTHEPTTRAAPGNRRNRRRRPDDDTAAPSVF